LYCLRINVKGKMSICSEEKQLSLNIFDPRIKSTYAGPLEKESQLQL
jgi:hypothetical protein